MSTSNRSHRHRSSPSHWARLLLVPVVLAFAACDSSTDPIDDNDNDHEDAARVTIETRGAASALLAEWIDGEGWMDANGNSIDQLPTPIDSEAEGLIDLMVGGPNASLTVTFFNPDGSEVDMGTVSRDDESRERVCTEYSARYYPLDNNTGVIAWPNMPHPEGPNQSFQFAERQSGQLVGIFHCDHIHFYPESAGEVDVEFRLWHGDHADGETDPIRIVVQENPNPDRFEIATRGPANTLLAEWIEGEGWFDADGNATDVLPTPIDAEGLGLTGMTADGPRASLTVRYFTGGEEVDITTLSRDDDTGERVCTDIQSRFTLGAGDDSVIAWPPQAHPDNPGGETQFAQWDREGELIANFHCNHIHFYPEAPGEVDIHFQAWSDGSVVKQSAGIRLVVED